MLKAVVLAIAIVGLQATDLRAQALGYAVGGLAGYDGFFGSGSSFHVAGGVEGLARRMMGAGAEAGFFDRLFTVSVNSVFHVPVGTAPLRPFVTAGYTKMGIGDGEGDAFTAWNVGVGGDLGSGRTALRFEVRDHVRPDNRGNVHYWTVRAGVVFR